MFEVPADGAIDEKAAELAPLVGINTAGARPPLLLVRTWKGEIAHERALARRLGDDQPIYSVAPPRGAKPEDFPADAQAWARLASARLRDVPYSGPLLLGGWSFGGVIAYETAQLLARSGSEIGLVALVDTRVPSQRPVRRRGRTRRGALHKSVRSLDHFLEQRGWRARLAYLQGRALRRQEKLSARARRVGGWWRSDAAAALPAWTAPAPDEATFETPTGRRITLLQRTIWVCYRKYRPSASAWPVLLLRTAESQEAAGDASLGWSAALHGDLESVRIPGEHFTIFDEPHVSELARRLASALGRAGGKLALTPSREAPRA